MTVITAELVRPSDFGWTMAADPLTVVIRQCGDAQAEMRSGNAVMRIATSGAGFPLGCFLADAGDWLCDAFVSRVLCEDGARLMFVRPSNPGYSWVCSIFAENNAWTCRVAQPETPRQISKEIPTDYAVAGNPDTEKWIGVLFETFQQLTGGDFLRAGDGSSIIRIKVDPREHWFLRFPVGEFAHLNGATIVDRPPGIQWILSARTFCHVSQEQRRVEREMTSTTAFLENSVIILNTYAAHSAAKDASKVSEGFRLIVRLLDCFQDVPIRGQRISLRWTLNPPPLQVRALLTDPGVRYVFANFEADSGVWETGDGEHRCNTPCAGHLTGERSKVDLGVLEGRLSHLTLLNVFHCHSFYSPGRTLNPADDGTIVAALLRSGAEFVTASPCSESALAFTAETLRMLLSRSELRMILSARGLEGKINPDVIIKQANALIQEAGLRPVKSLFEKETS